MRPLLWVSGPLGGVSPQHWQVCVLLSITSWVCVVLGAPATQEDAVEMSPASAGVPFSSAVTDRALKPTEIAGAAFPIFFTLLS